VDELRAWLAYGDSWWVHGNLRAGRGGGALELPGVRLTASGLPARPWNNGDVDDPAVVDVDRVRDWYAALDLPWGLRVPTGARWGWGEPMFHGRMMSLTRTAFRPAFTAAWLTIAAAGPAELDDAAGVDLAAFGGQPNLTRAWLAPQLQSGPVTTMMAWSAGRALGTGYLVRTDGRAGPAGCLGGVGVVPDARRRGVGLALSSCLVAAAFDSGAELVVLSPDSPAAADLYSQLGFTETNGFDVYIAA